MNNGCPTHGWSLITSATPDSQVAGVLAGFIFTGVVLLLGRRGKKSTQALGLLCAAFVALGFDSHLFGVVSAESSDPFCSRVWAQEMMAAGLLGVGGMAIVAGIGWLLASHLDETTPHDNPPAPEDTSKAINLDRLLRVMAYGAGVTITLLLGSTAYDYLSTIYKTHIPEVLGTLVLWSPIGVLMLTAGIAFAGAWRAHSNPKITRAGIANRGLSVAAYGIMAYAVIGPVLAGEFGQLGNSRWQPTSKFIVYLVIIFGLGVPSILTIALVIAVPPLASRAQTTQSISMPQANCVESEPGRATRLTRTPISTAESFYAPTNEGPAANNNPNKSCHHPGRHRFHGTSGNSES